MGPDQPYLCCIFGFVILVEEGNVSFNNGFCVLTFPLKAAAVINRDFAGNTRVALARVRSLLRGS